MVIEYSGTVIRSVLTDKREKYYDGKVRSKIGIKIQLESKSFNGINQSTSVLSYRVSAVTCFALMTTRW